MLTCLVPVLFTFYTQDVLKLKKYNSGAKGLNIGCGISRLPSRLHDFLFGQSATANYDARSPKFVGKPWIERPRLPIVVTSQNTHEISPLISGLPIKGKGLDKPWGFQEVVVHRILIQSPHEGAKIVSPKHRPPLPPGNIPGTHMIQAESNPWLWPWVGRKDYVNEKSQWHWTAVNPCGPWTDGKPYIRHTINPLNTELNPICQ